MRSSRKSEKRDLGTFQFRGRTITYDEIRAKCDGPFPMELTSHSALAVIAAVSQGIDSRLEACYIKERGDYYDTAASLGTPRLVCRVSPESLPVLIRRLAETGRPVPTALAQSILETLEVIPDGG